MRPLLIHGLLLVLACGCATAPTAQAAEAYDRFPDKLLDMGTASEEGIFHRIGGGLCEEANKARERTLVRCVASPTSGPDYNLQALSEGVMRLGLAFSGLSRSPVPASTRHLMTLYDSPIVVIGRGAAGIRDIGDIRGKRIEIGTPTSGRRLLVDQLLEALGLPLSEFAGTTELSSPSALGAAFCNAEVDVIIEGYGLPDSTYERLARDCGGVFLHIPEAARELMLIQYPGLQRVDIDIGRFTGKPGETLPTLDQKVILVTDERVGQEALQRFIATVLAAAKNVRKIDPHLAGFDAESALLPLPAIPSHAAVAAFLQRAAARPKVAK